MKKGEIWIIEFPASNGHEQRGLRPAIIAADTPTGIISAIPCTGNLQALRFPFTLRIEPSKVNGFDAPTVALLLQLCAIDRNRCVKRIGTVEPETIRRINRLLRTFLGL